MGTKCAPPRRARFLRQRERILDAATMLLNEKGVRGMTLLDVAQALDLKTTSVTYYLRYKEELAAAVLEDSIAGLEAMAREAAALDTPRARVQRYVELYFDRYARSLRGQIRPLAILSEIRALEGNIRERLNVQYQGVFRLVRSFFGTPGDERQKRVFEVRTQILNEALFWSVIWLKHYMISDYRNVGRRLFAILNQGIVRSPLPWYSSLVELQDPAPEAVDRSAFLRVATRLINEIGYRGASIDRITSELNVTRGSFYHHVDTKEDLVLECSRVSYRRLGRLQSLARQQHGSGWRSLASVVVSAITVQLYDQYPFLRSTALQAIPGSLREIALEQANRTSLWLSGALVDAMQEGSVRIIDPLIASHIIMAAVNSAYDMRHWARRQAREASIETYAASLFCGLFA